VNVVTVLYTAHYISSSSSAVQTIAGVFNRLAGDLFMFLGQLLFLLSVGKQ
jgi:hypothetical protein